MYNDASLTTWSCSDNIHLVQMLQSYHLLTKSAIVVGEFGTGEFVLQFNENGEGLSEAESCEANDVKNGSCVVVVALILGEDRQELRKCMGKKHYDLKAKGTDH